MCVCFLLLHLLLMHSKADCARQPSFLMRAPTHRQHNTNIYSFSGCNLKFIIKLAAFSAAFVSVCVQQTLGFVSRSKRSLLIRRPHLEAAHQLFRSCSALVLLLLLLSLLCKVPGQKLPVNSESEYNFWRLLCERIVPSYCCSSS